MRNITVIDRQTRFGYFAWPTVARLNDGRLIVVCSGFRMRHVCPFGKVTAFYSSDEGESWSAPAVLSDTALDARDAGIAVLDDCVLTTTFTASRAVQKKYLDAWYRMPTLEKENAFIERYLDTVDDRTEAEQSGTFIMTWDGTRTGRWERAPFGLSAPHGPFRLQDGDAMYIGEKRGFGADEAAGPIVCARRSRDGVWTQLGTIPCPDNGLRYCEPHGVQLPDGRIVAHLRAQSDEEFSVWQSVSDDGGKTFSPPERILADGAPPHLLLHSSGALVCAYANRTMPGAGPRAAVSTDGGKSWDRRIVLRSDAAGGDIGYASSVELRDGSVLTVFYYTDRKGKDKTAIESVVWRLDEAKPI